MSLFGLLKVKLSSLIKTFFKKKKDPTNKKRGIASGGEATSTQTDFHLIPKVATRGRHPEDAVHSSLPLPLFPNFFLLVATQCLSPDSSGSAPAAMPAAHTLCQTGAKVLYAWLHPLWPLPPCIGGK